MCNLQKPHKWLSADNYAYFISTCMDGSKENEDPKRVIKLAEIVGVLLSMCLHPMYDLTELIRKF